jgi:hypothetical protein
MPECIMAVLAHNLLPLISGNPFSLLVEKENAPIQIVGNNALLEAVQDMLKIVAMAH